MRNFFNNDNFLWRWFSKIGDFLGLSVVWLLCCVPLITIVPSCISLYDSIAHCVQGDEDHPYKRFFHTFKSELLRGIVLTILWVLIAFLLSWGYQILYQMGQDSQLAAIYSLVYLGTMLVPLGVFAWLIPIESRFQHSFGSLHKAALTFAIAHLPTTGIILLVLIVSVALLMFFPALILLLPAIMVTIQCWFIEKVFKTYTPEENEDDTAA